MAEPGKLSLSALASEVKKGGVYFFCACLIASCMVLGSVCECLYLENSRLHKQLEESYRDQIDRLQKDPSFIKMLKLRGVDAECMEDALCELRRISVEKKS